ncbi:hypothetical protein HYS10_01245, partial [Candidatus Collierbacteria bacterium]|nr:hypothetical protein [Candidatus Collierbacteria bacterium]
MEQKPPEPVTKTSPTELLKQHRENPLFWFLKNIPDSELTKLQYKRYREQTQLSDQITLEAEIETL